jgi:Raf kinase inhibitor-like YbhB/YbcL family protein
MALTLTSPAFTHGHEIPARYTDDGEDLSPPLAWTGVPREAKSLALIVEDPDAPDPAHPKRIWVHWVVYDIPPSSSSLAEGARDEDLPEGACLAANDWGRQAWGGPAPPIGRHRYFFRLYALDSELPPDLAKKADVVRAMDGHVLAEAELMGTYQRAVRRAV